MLPSFKKTSAQIIFFLSCQLCAVAAVASKGDHPLLGPMAGFESVQKDTYEFDVIELTVDNINQVKGKRYDGPLKFEGKVTKIRYSGEFSTSSVSIYRNYLRAVQELGGKALSTRPDGEYDCDWNVFEVPRKPNPSITVLQKNCSHGGYYIWIVEPQAMVQSVKASAMAEELKADGIATLYIQFDTNKFELKTDGQAAVTEIVKLLNLDKALRLSIDGHTDNVGDAAANRKLSLARAQAVMQAVAAQGIDAKRLKAQGFGPEVPIADNRKEDGRAKNRRVELVRQP